MDDKPYNYKLTIAYDGTNYCGWQIQPNGISIQEILQDKIKIIAREDVKLIGSGRTDAGVHAFGQVAHFRCNKELDVNRFAHSLNALIPEDIRVIEMERAALDFHAQYNAKGKIYHYNLHLDQVMDPFRRLYAYHVLEKIDLAQMQRAASYFKGTHDFTSFANEAHRGTAAHDPVRTLDRLDIMMELGGVRLEFEGDGFLYKMVRNIVGTLLEVGKGKLQPEDIASILNAKDRRKASQAVPPQGLFLVEVKY